MHKLLSLLLFLLLFPDNIDKYFGVASIFFVIPRSNIAAVTFSIVESGQVAQIEE